MKVYHLLSIKQGIDVKKMKAEFHCGYFNSLVLMNLFFIKVEKNGRLPSSTAGKIINRSLTRKNTIRFRGSFEHLDVDQKPRRFSKISRSECSKNELRNSFFGSFSIQPTSEISEKVQVKINFRKKILDKMKKKLKKFEARSMLKYGRQKKKDESDTEEKMDFYIGAGKFPWRKYRRDIMSKSEDMTRKTRTRTNLNYGMSIDYIEDENIYSKKKVRIKSDFLLPGVNYRKRSRKKFKTKIDFGKNKKHILTKFERFSNKLEHESNESSERSTKPYTRLSTGMKRKIVDRVSRSLNFSNQRKQDLVKQNDLLKKNKKFSKKFQKDFLKKNFEILNVDKNTAEMIKYAESLYLNEWNKKEIKKLKLEPLNNWKTEKINPENNFFLKKRKKNKFLKKQKPRDFNLSLLLKTKIPRIHDNNSTVSTLRKSFDFTRELERSKTEDLHSVIFHNLMSKKKKR